MLQPGGALVITLDRYADKAPLDGAITLTLDGQEPPTERQGLGLFVVRHPRLEQPVTSSRDTDAGAGNDMGPAEPWPWRGRHVDLTVPSARLKADHIRPISTRMRTTISTAPMMPTPPWPKP